MGEIQGPAMARRCHEGRLSEFSSLSVSWKTNFNAKWTRRASLGVLGTDLAEGLAGNVRRTTDGHRSVVTKSGLVEVRVVGDVEELRPELEVGALALLELFR